MKINYKVIPNGDNVSLKWKTSTVQYIHRLLYQDGAGIVDYHWHPVDTPDKAFPHLHVRELEEKRHYPTGRVMIEDVFTLAVECGAVPRDRAKWEAIRDKNLLNFRKGATWGLPRH